jgi:hypothetical protein
MPCCVLVRQQAGLRKQELTGLRRQRHASITSTCCLNNVEQG